MKVIIKEKAPSGIICHSNLKYGKQYKIVDGWDTYKNCHFTYEQTSSENMIFVLDPPPNSIRLFDMRYVPEFATFVEAPLDHITITF